MSRDDELFGHARTVIPGGVNSPVRAFGAVGGTPLFIERGEGAYVWDAEGTKYLDLVQSWGALLFGHARPEIVEAAVTAAREGTSFGAPTEREVLLAKRIVDAVPSVERVRLVSSGTEATMSAIRLARGATGRDLILKFEGCYHGHSDALLARGGGSGLATFGIPGSPGVTEGAARDTLAAPFNDLEAARAIMRERGDAVACVIVEPVAANMGVVPPTDGFLVGLRDLCTEHGALLVFDEVITGFRLAYGGAQERFGIDPDLTTLGKVMGGGFPSAAFGGRAEIMQRLAPEGPIYQAGTLSGNPVAVAAGIAALDLARAEDPYAGLERTADELVAGLTDALRVPATIEPGGVPVQRVLHRDARDGLRRCAARGPRAVRPVLPSPARPGHRAAPERLRAVVARDRRTAPARWNGSWKPRPRSRADYAAEAIAAAWSGSSVSVGTDATQHVPNTRPPLERTGVTRHAMVPSENPAGRPSRADRCASTTDRFVPSNRSETSRPSHHAGSTRRTSAAASDSVRRRRSSSVVQKKVHPPTGPVSDGGTTPPRSRSVPVTFHCRMTTPLTTARRHRRYRRRRHRSRIGRATEPVAEGL